LCAIVAAAAFPAATGAGGDASEADGCDAFCTVQSCGLDAASPRRGGHGGAAAPDSNDDGDAPPLSTNTTTVWPPRPRGGRGGGGGGVDTPIVAVLLASLVTHKNWVDNGLGGAFVRRVLAPLDADLFVVTERDPAWSAASASSLSASSPLAPPVADGLLGMSRARGGQDDGAPPPPPRYLRAWRTLGAADAQRECCERLRARWLPRHQARNLTADASGFRRKHPRF
jgi:hypothetical protein